MSRRRVILGGALLVLALAAAAEWAVRSVPVPATIGQPARATPVLVDIRGRAFYRPATETARDARPIPLRDMGEWLPKVTVGIEDHRFYSHPGVDLVATAGAALRNLRNGRIVSGASTITQQTVKMATERSRRTLGVKWREARMALALERYRDKKTILEDYLNRLDYGNRRIGPEAAAQAYFGKPAAHLTLAEAIFLAGIPQSPARLNPWTRPAAAAERYRRNVVRLGELGLLPEASDAAFLLAHPPVVTRHDPERYAEHFAAMVPLAGREGVVTTTLDLDMQRTAETLVAEHLRAAAVWGIGDCAMVVLENATGEVRAFVSAGQPRHAEINAAATPRSCGSTLKPFLYAAAIEARLLTAATILPDTAEAVGEEFADYDPQNYSRRFHGPVRAREALANSLNVPAVVVAARLGARSAFDQLAGWGFRFSGSFDAYGAGFVLGNADVRLVDLAAAMAGLARGGSGWGPRFTANDSLESRQMVSLETAAIVADILCDNEARHLSFGLNSPLDLGARVAVKTGTSSGFRDRWCVGFSADHTVAVWAGNLDGQAMGEVLAVRAAAPLWAAMMRHLLAHGSKPLDPPGASPHLVQCPVSARTGLLPEPGESSVTEWFLAGTEPRESSSTWLAPDGELLLPPEFAAWTTSPQNRTGAQARSGPLRILFPKDGSRFLINPHLPPERQKIRMQASSAPVQWLLNGEPVDGDAIALEPGAWTLTALVGDESVSAQFTVE